MDRATHESGSATPAPCRAVASVAALVLLPLALAGCAGHAPGIADPGIAPPSPAPTLSERRGEPIPLYGRGNGRRTVSGSPATPDAGSGPVTTPRPTRFLDPIAPLYPSGYRVPDTRVTPVDLDAMAERLRARSPIDRHDPLTIVPPIDPAAPLHALNPATPVDPFDRGPGAPRR